MGKAEVLPISLKQHNYFIEAKYRLTLVEKKFLVGVAFFWQRQCEQAGQYSNEVTLSASELCRLTGLSLESTRLFQSAIKKLMSKVITMKHIGTKASSLFHFFYLGHYNNGLLQLYFVDEMRPFFFDLSREFTIYGLDCIKQLHSEYSIRIFELLKQYQNTKSQRRVFRVEELMQLLGIEQGKYHRYSDFKRKVLNVAYRECNAKTDIRFSIEERRQGKRVTEIVFNIET
ncbi:MAG: replication initiation protein [Nitrospirae bacterium]|nr:replication initiation protein [Nitrospirota bacterium]